MKTLIRATAKVGYEARFIDGKIGSGGSRINWYCYADEGSIFELEVDTELFNKNKNRIKKREMETLTKQEQKLYMNTATGSVDTIDGWHPFDENNGLIEVEKNNENEWEEVK